MSASTPTRPSPERAPGRAAAQAPPVGEGRRRSPLWLLDLYRSALGKKYAMAISGIVLLAYVLLHMIGNFKLYLGPEAMNHYRGWLREFGTPALPTTGFLGITPVVLLVAAIRPLARCYAVTLMHSW